MSFTGIIKKLFRDPPPAVQKRTDTPGARHWISNPWHAVSIVPSRQSCTAAHVAVGERYLSKDAPALPLAGCSQVNCLCRFKHHEDRRHELRRAADVWNSGRMWTGTERRERRGRRATDGA